MIILQYSLFFSFLISISLYADKISISGTVEHGESGNPVVNADVYLYFRSHLKTRTDLQGKFELAGELTSSISEPKKDKIPAISINNNSVNLILTSPARVNVSVFNISGKKVYHTDACFNGAGVKKILLPMDKLVIGVYIISVKHSLNRAIFRYIHSENSYQGISEISNKNCSTKKACISSNIHSEEFSDILVVVSDTTQKARIPLVTFKQSDIKIKLMPPGVSNSTPGVPLFADNGTYGDVTTYGSPDNPEYSEGGACNYGSTGILYYAAINVHQIPGDFKGDWENGRACGRCAKVSVRARDGSIRSTIVRITDKCPDDNCGIDLGGAPAKIIMDNQIGRYSGEWEWVSCENAQGVSDGPPSLHIKEGSNEWWSLVQVRNGPGGINQIRVRKVETTEWDTLSIATEAENFYKLPPQLLQDNENWEIETIWDTGSRGSLIIAGNKMAIENASYELEFSDD